MLLFKIVVIINEGGKFKVWMSGILIGIRIVNVFYEVLVVNEIIVLVKNSIGIIK